MGQGRALSSRQHRPRPAPHPDPARGGRPRRARPRGHGFRGGAEIAATLDPLAAFAHLAGVVPPHLFDLSYQATPGDADLPAFMAEANPQALAAMRDRFAALDRAGLWQTRPNPIAAALHPEPDDAR